MISIRPSQSENTPWVSRAAKFAAGLMMAGALGVAGAGAAGAIETNPQKIETNPQKIETNPQSAVSIQRIETNPLIEANPQW